MAHRLTKDHPQRVRKLATLDIIPTRKMFQIVDKDMAANTYHWFFLIQPFDFPDAGDWGRPRLLHQIQVHARPGRGASLSRRGN